nr:hypothetical protein [Tanacetum cinerariifolium]
MITNEMHEQTAHCVSVKEHTKVVDALLIAELVIYREHVELYERWAKFKLTEREEKIEEQLRIVITDRNIKEANLKKELHSVKMQLNSTINHNQSMVEEVTSLKKNFQQKENKYLKEFLDMKALERYPLATRTLMSYPCKASSAFPVQEDLEALWCLVKERFSTAKPKNFSDDFLLTTLGAMFGKPDAHA